MADTLAAMRARAANKPAVRRFGDHECSLAEVIAAGIPALSASTPTLEYDPTAFLEIPLGDTAVAPTPTTAQLAVTGEGTLVGIGAGAEGQLLIVQSQQAHGDRFIIDSGAGDPGPGGNIFGVGYKTTDNGDGTITTETVDAGAVPTGAQLVFMYSEYWWVGWVCLTPFPVDGEAPVAGLSTVAPTFPQAPNSTIDNTVDSVALPASGQLRLEKGAGTAILCGVGAGTDGQLLLVTNVGSGPVKLDSGAGSPPAGTAISGVSTKTTFDIGNSTITTSVADDLTLQPGESVWLRYHGLFATWYGVSPVANGGLVI